MDEYNNSRYRIYRFECRRSYSTLTQSVMKIQKSVRSPIHCWAAVAAKDLDNGSKRDNCVSNLHFAAAYMDSVIYWTNYWTQYLENKCGQDEYLGKKVFYDSWVTAWINCYVFNDTVHFNECRIQ